MGYVDADTHALETNRTWEYLDPSERQYKPECLVSAGDDPQTIWLIDGWRYRYGRYSRSSEVTAVEGPARDMTDVALRVEWMDRLGVDYQVVYPSVFISVVIQQPEIEAALMRSYNRWMAEISDESRGRLRWAVVPALGSLDRAIEDLEFGRDHGAVAVYMRGLEKNRLLNDPYFYPLYEKAQDLDLAIGIHVGSSLSTLRAVERGAVMVQAVPNVVAFHNLLMSEVPQRFPRLRFGFLESTATWIPWALEEGRRGGLTAVRQRLEVGAEMIADSRLFVACTIDDDLPYLLQYSGEDTLVVGTDFGHSDRGTDIEAHSLVMERTDVDLAVRRKIVDDNGRRLYGLGPATAPAPERPAAATVS